jgi:hypothetical protein
VGSSAVVGLTAGQTFQPFPSPGIGAFHPEAVAWDLLPNPSPCLSLMHLSLTYISCDTQSAGVQKRSGPRTPAPLRWKGACDAGRMYGGGQQQYGMQQDYSQGQQQGMGQQDMSNQMGVMQYTNVMQNDQMGQYQTQQGQYQPAQGQYDQRNGQAQQGQQMQQMQMDYSQQYQPQVRLRTLHRLAT